MNGKIVLVRSLMVLFSVNSLVGCVDAARNSAELHSSQEREMTVGIVQRELKPGMSQDQVAAALGSPNIVSRDTLGLETWIYDKVASEASYSKSEGGMGILGGIAAEAGSVLLLGIPSASYSKQAGASASTQRTLTVIVKFDDRSQLDSATFHSSKF